MEILVQHNLIELMSWRDAGLISWKCTDELHFDMPWTTAHLSAPHNNWHICRHDPIGRQ